ncbi:MAG: peptide ABC transporter substrate-binding protein [Candidatus Eremiobacteraeota bacterium]|nr:peptide ABC transporter substrate-binding protein [Candidatus Eremiobacteraeota bacterium]
MLLLLCTVIAPLQACTRAGTTGSNESTRHSWTRPGVLRFAENADPKTLNPLLGSSAVTGDLSMFLFSYAVRYNDKAQPVPDALREIPTVENGDVSKDGKTLKYKLRPNIKWHDGQPLTSKDLWFTWKAVMNTHNNVVTTDGYKDIASIDYGNPHIAVVHMKRLYAPFLQQLWGVNSNAPILPEHILGKYNDDKGSLNTATYNSAPVGSGPFKFVSWQRGSSVRLVAFPEFYLGKPKLNQVIFKILPDENTLVTQLQTHEIDLLARGTGLNWPRYTAIATPESGLKAIRVHSFQYAHIDFNLRRPLFADLRLRKALAFATNRAEIIDKIAHGSADPAPADQSPKLSWAYTPDVERHDYDPAKARQLLEQAGWKVGRDGIRTKNGQRLAFDHSTQTEATNGKAIQALVQREWHDVGADVTVKNAPTNSFFDNTVNGVLQGGHYDVAGFSWVASADPDDSAIYSAGNLAPHGQNALFWTDKPATDAMNAALRTVDRNQRKAQYKIVQQRLASQVPTIILYFLQEPEVYNTDLKGFDPPSPVISTFWNPWEYSI